MGDEFNGVNISNLQKGINFGGYQNGKSIKIDKDFIDIIKLAAEQDGDKKNLSMAEAQSAMTMLKEKGYELKMSVEDFLTKIKDSVLDSKNLKSSKTDKSTNVTTNTYKEGKDKWTVKLDNEGREVGGTYIDGTEFTTTYDDEVGTYTRSYNIVNKVFDSATQRLVQYKKNDEVVYNVKYNNDGSYEYIYNDNSMKVFDKYGVHQKSYYANGNLEAELVSQKYKLVGTYYVEGQDYKTEQWAMVSEYKLYDEQGGQKGVEFAYDEGNVDLKQVKVNPDEEEQK